MGLCAHELRQSIDDNIDAADVEGESSDDLEPSGLVLLLLIITS